MVHQGLASAKVTFFNLLLRPLKAAIPIAKRSSFSIPDLGKLIGLFGSVAVY